MRDYHRSVITSFHNRTNNPKLLVNMDDTAIHRNCAPNRTMHHKGARTVSIRIAGTESMRFTLSVTAAMDGTKLPLFVILKGRPGGSI